MKKLVAGLLLMAFTMPVSISVKDFKPAFGAWKGTLTYLDYSSGKPYTMPANLRIAKDKANDQQLVLDLEYPDEPRANGKDTLVISKDGSMIDGAVVISKETTGDKYLKIITEKAGIDGNDNRKAIIKHIYTISRRVFISRKEVRFDGEHDFILRNEFNMVR